MRTITLGKTGLKTKNIGFGALPIQRTTKHESKKILQKAYENGINFYDTARAYTDSEEKIASALKKVRENIIIASKTQTETTEKFWNDLETTLKNLKTDYIDLYQLHNIQNIPQPGDKAGLYDALTDAKNQDLIKHIGVTAHKHDIALQAIESDLYETLQYPFSYLTGKTELQIVQKTLQKGMGFIAMKAMAGGLIHNSKAAYAYMNQYPQVLPIYGIQKEEELDQFLQHDQEQVVMDKQLEQEISQDRKELSGNFCRGCGYCQPCPEEITINLAARMSLWIRRFPTEPFLTQEYQDLMEKTQNCTECGACIKKCPYELNIPELLKENYTDYQNILRQNNNP